jgi:hypothetical protein
MSINTVYLLDSYRRSFIYGIILASGSVWGLVEFGAGIGLQKCTGLLSGAILSGLSFFWLSLIWSTARKWIPILMVVLIAMAYKWLDTLLLGLSWNHGSVVNPIFAFLTALTGFFLLQVLFGDRFFRSRSARILTGALAALVSMCLFPLAGYVTGTPVCLYGATRIPVSVITAPVAIAVAMLTVPLGFRTAGWLTNDARHTGRLRNPAFILRWYSPAIFMVSVTILVLVRLM